MLYQQPNHFFLPFLSPLLHLSDPSTITCIPSSTQHFRMTQDTKLPNAPQRSQSLLYFKYLAWLLATYFNQRSFMATAGRKTMYFFSRSLLTVILPRNGRFCQSICLFCCRFLSLLQQRYPFFYLFFSLSLHRFVNSSSLCLCLVMTFFLSLALSFTALFIHVCIHEGSIVYIEWTLEWTVNGVRLVFSGYSYTAMCFWVFLFLTLHL